MRLYPSLRTIPALAVAALLGAQAARAQVTVTAIVPTTAITGSDPVPLRAQVGGTVNDLVVWRLEAKNTGACALDAAGNWQYQPPHHREEFMNVQVRVTSMADPRQSTVATLVLMPTNTLWQVLNDTLNGPPAQEERNTAVGGKRKTEGQAAGAGQADPKRRRLEAGPAPAAASYRYQWQPAAWMQANGNAHFCNLPYWCTDPDAPLRRTRFPELQETQRFVRGRAGALALPPLAPGQPLYVGYKTPLDLEFDHLPGFQPVGQVMALEKVGDWYKEDVTGRKAIRLAPEASALCWVHSLMPSPSVPGLFQAQDHLALIFVRGLLPYVGNPAEPPALEDGVGDQARFTEPLGLACAVDTSDAKLTAGTPGAHPASYVASTDAGSHAIRRSGLRSGRVSTPWGKAVEPGHQDGTGAEARFRQPSFLASLKAGGFLVSDTGNHVLRVVDGDQVRTLAGVPGQSGHRDGPAHLALFHTPQGLCAGPDGTVYVADQGNHVIRQITREGVVSTLAGLAGQSGSTDAVRDQARFTQLKGMACMDRALFVVDGHAVRLLNLDNGRVTTLCGQVLEPGFAPSGSLFAGQPILAPRACLRNPRDLTAQGGFLYVADEGNHCVQKISVHDRTWTVVAGDPDRPELAYGLLRDGLPGPLPPAVGTLPAPKGILATPDGILVSTSRSIVKLNYEFSPGIALPRAILASKQAEVAVKEICPVALNLLSAHPRGACYNLETELQAWERREVLPLLMDYELEFINADGSVASRTAGVCRKTDPPKFFQGCFTKPGKGRVVFRGRTHQGVGVFAEGGDREYTVSEAKAD